LSTLSGRSCPTVDRTGHFDADLISVGGTCCRRQISDDIGAQIDLIGVPWADDRL